MLSGVRRCGPQHVACRGGDPVRVLYAFNPLRTAILLLGGIKTGNDRWYEEHVPLADQLYDVHLKELRKEGLLK